MSLPRDAEPDLTDVGGIRIRASHPQLRQVQFEVLPTADPESADNAMSLGLGVDRLGQWAVGIELTAQSEDDSPVVFSIAYRVVLTVEPVGNSGPDIDSDTTLKEVSARLGPVILYPYVRETLSSLSVKAGRKPLVLPVINAGMAFDPGEVELPPAPDVEPAAESVSPRTKKPRKKPKRS